MTVRPHTPHTSPRPAQKAVNPALRRTLQTLLAGLGLLSALVLWHNWGDLLSPTAPQSAHTPTPSHDPALIEQGLYLARAGNCIACHSAKGGAALAGGRPIETPFGTVYSSNLTPDEDTGLGRWTAQDFWQALHLGRSRSGRLLAPAFPYQHTSAISRPDSDALFAWLRSQTPVQQAQSPAALVWPLNTAVTAQIGLALWRTLFFTPRPFEPDPQQSAAWNRGAYLVQGLGHCGACHSPRNAFGASAAPNALSGGRMPGQDWYAPDLLSERETGLASTAIDQTLRLLQTGRNDHASVSGPMSEVVQHSLQHLRPDDVQAIALYLQARAQQNSAPAATPATTPATANAQPHAPANIAPRVAQLGAKVYERHCATCHGAQGQGVPGIYPALAGNRAVLLDEPVNLVQAVLYGGFGPATAGNPRPFGMPPFVLTLSDHEIAAVLTHLRTSLQSPHPPASEVTPWQVNRIR